MASMTKIEWCDTTWNPVTGCLHGCEYCYARGIAQRFEGYWNEEWLRHKGADGNLHDLIEPLHRHTTGKNRYNPVHSVVAPYPFGFYPTFHRYLLDKPQTWKKPRTIFVGSMTDLFGAWVPDEWIKEVFKACEKAPQHRYLFLTKNPKRYIELAVEGVLVFGAEKWYGTTITDESDAGRVRIMEKAICESPLSNAFLSIEPLLGKIDIDSAALESINWLIIGAETGNRKGKIIPRREWVELICAAADKHRIPVFMKRGELLNGKAVKAGMEEPRYFMKELMGTGFRQEFPWEMEK